MCKWKLVWKSAMFHLRQEMRNPRFLLSFVLAFVLCLMLSDKAVFFAESYGTSMQVFETFILAFGDGKSIMISTLLLIFLFADLPVKRPANPLLSYKDHKKYLDMGSAFICISCDGFLCTVSSSRDLHHLR